MINTTDHMLKAPGRGARNGKGGAGGDDRAGDKRKTGPTGLGVAGKSIPARGRDKSAGSGQFDGDRN